MVETIRSISPVKPEKKKDSDAKNESPNRGKLIVDATCAPADISYPTDLGLLNGARVHTEKIIDILYKQIVRIQVKNSWVRAEKYGNVVRWAKNQSYQQH